MRKMIAVVGLCIIAAGCTDAERASWGALGSEGTIKCYSGGQVVFDSQSTGKIIQGKDGGLLFREKGSGKYVRAYADCIVKEI